MVHAAMERVPDDGETSPGFECRLERERARSGEYFGLWAVALDCFAQVESDLWLRSVYVGFSETDDVGIQIVHVVENGV